MRRETRLEAQHHRAIRRDLAGRPRKYLGTRIACSDKPALARASHLEARPRRLLREPPHEQVLRRRAPMRGIAATCRKPGNIAWNKYRKLRGRGERIPLHVGDIQLEITEIVCSAQALVCRISAPID